MQVAYELRAAPTCDAKKALFERVRADGDYRSLQVLQIVGRRGHCRVVHCCLPSHDKELKSTVRTLMDRQ